MTAGVLCAVRGRAEPEIVRALGSGRADVEVTRRCADVAELLAAAAAGLGRVAVVSADLPRLDREAVRHLQGSGAWVVLVTSASAGDDLGADAVVDTADAHDAVVLAVAELLDRGGGPGDVVPAGTADLPEPREPVVVPVGAPGVVVAVWGPTGAPGRSTVAVNLAAEVAALDDDPSGVLLVDADTYGGCVAPMLGMLDEAPGVAAAVRTAAAGRLDLVALASFARQVSPRLRVLTGVARPDRWPEVSAAGLDVLWDRARELAAWTVVDCGFCLEEDEALSYDTRAPRRNAATLSALAAADLVVVVGSGDPLGLQRLVRGVADLDDVGVPPSARLVVVNRVRASAGGPRPGEAVTEALRRYAGVRDVRLVPHDGPACDGALLAARTLAEHAEGSPARRALVDLARDVLARRPVMAAH